MRRHHVRSSVLASVGYDEDAHTLEIEFHSGSVYRYFDVPSDVYDRLLAAESHGEYFSHHIRDQYPYERDTNSPDERS